MSNKKMNEMKKHFDEVYTINHNGEQYDYQEGGVIPAYAGEYDHVEYLQ